jgi:hypothetical protein
METTKETAVHPAIAVLEKTDQPTVTISGYRGTSDDTVVRLYQTLDTSIYVEIPKEDVVYLDTDQQPEPGYCRAFVRASSEILTVQRLRVQASDSSPRFPPLQPKPSFWTCAGGCEGVFIGLATRILQDTASALKDPDPNRQAMQLAQIEQRKSEAKRALFYCLSTCVTTYGAPPWMTVPDSSAPGGLLVERFSLPGYYQMIVERDLEPQAIS